MFSGDYALRALSIRYPDSAPSQKPRDASVFRFPHARRTGVFGVHRLQVTRCSRESTHCEHQVLSAPSQRPSEYTRCPLLLLDSPGSSPQNRGVLFHPIGFIKHLAFFGCLSHFCLQVANKNMLRGFDSPTQCAQAHCSSPQICKKPRTLVLGFLHICGDTPKNIKPCKNLSFSLLDILSKQSCATISPCKCLIKQSSEGHR